MSCQSISAHFRWGSAWGARGPEFKSRRSDQYLRAIPKVRWSHQWSHLRETTPHQASTASLLSPRLADGGLTTFACDLGLLGCRLSLRAFSRLSKRFVYGRRSREFPDRCVECDRQCRIAAHECVPLKLETFAASLERQLQTFGRYREDVSATADRQLSLQSLLE